jgi:hypothetical protein
VRVTKAKGRWSFYSCPAQAKLGLIFKILWNKLIWETNGGKWEEAGSVS